MLLEIGKRNIGIIFKGTMGQLVVTNKYMDTIFDINKAKECIEKEVVGENSASALDARKVLALLKFKMRRK